MSPYHISFSVVDFSVESSMEPTLQLLPYSLLDIEREEIHFLELLPSRTQDGVVECQMHHASLTETPNILETLSYVWGDQAAT